MPQRKSTLSYSIHKGENIAAFMTPKAMVNLPVRIDVKLGDFSLWNGQSATKFGSSPLHGK